MKKHEKIGLIIIIVSILFVLVGGITGLGAITGIRTGEYKIEVSQNISGFCNSYAKGTFLNVGEELWIYFDAESGSPCTNQPFVVLIDGEVVKEYGGLGAFREFEWTRGKLIGFITIDVPEGWHDISVWDKRCVTPGYSGQTQCFGSLQVYKESELCRLKEGYVLVTQDFSAGETIELTDFRLEPKAFCYMAPALKLDSSGGILEQTIEPYKFLQLGEYVTVPEGEVWRLNYVAEVSSSLPVVCDANSFYDVDTKECIPKPGFVFYCARGQYSESEKACVIQPDTKYVCDSADAVYDSETGKCIIFVSETEPVCPAESELVVENGEYKCVFEPKTEYVCSEGVFRNGVCVVEPPQVTDSVSGIEFLFNDFFGKPVRLTTIVIGVIGVLVGLFVFFKGGS